MKPRSTSLCLAILLLLAPLCPADAHAQPLAAEGPRVGVVDVRSFGAKCDGATDDYDAIARAMAQAATRPGNIIYFPPAKQPCMISRALKLERGATLQSEPGATVLKATTGNRSQPVLLALADNVRVSGLAFDGGGKDHPNGASVIQGYQVSNVVLEKIALRHSHGIGLLMSSNITNSIVRDSEFDDLGNGWRTSHLAKDRKQGLVFCCGTGNHGNTARGNHFQDIGLDALQFADQTDVTITENRFNLENRQRQAVKAPDYPAAIFIMRVNGVTVTGNVVHGAQGNCIDGPGLKNATLAHNEVTACGASGIGVFDTRSYGGPVVTSDHVAVFGNRISNVGLWRWASPAQRQPIFISPTATHVTLVDNQISGH